MNDFVDIFIHKGGFPYKNTPMIKWRKDYIKSLDPFERGDSIIIWRLLEEACRKSLGIELNNLNPRRLETGKIVIDDYHVSLSHSGGLYMVAISSHPVGVDIQKVRERDVVNANSSTWSKEERLLLSTNEPWRNYKYWARKEALYKLYDFGIPYNEETRHKINTASRQYNGIYLDGRINIDEFYFTIASELVREGVVPNFHFYPEDLEVEYDINNTK